MIERWSHAENQVVELSPSDFDDSDRWECLECGTEQDGGDECRECLMVRGQF